MRVTARLYTPPGRGEFYRKHRDLPDEQAPRTEEEFRERSVKALRYFWDNLEPNPATTVDAYDNGLRHVVSGEGWEVEWLTERSE